MTQQELYDDVLKRCQTEFPKFRMQLFDSTWFGRLLKKLAPGAAGITVWNTVYVDSDYIGTEKGARLLNHEIVHVRDQHHWLILFPISYFLLLPVGPSLKAVWEWRAYKEDLRWIRDHPYPDAAYQKYLEDYYCQWVAGNFCSSLYLWMWPFWGAMYKKAQKFMASLP